MFILLKMGEAGSSRKVNLIKSASFGDKKVAVIQSRQVAMKQGFV